jgi:hypothetical protein
VIVASTIFAFVIEASAILVVVTGTCSNSWIRIRFRPGLHRAFPEGVRLVGIIPAANLFAVTEPSAIFGSSYTVH